MSTHPLSDLLLHNFPENGLKFLLHNPANLRDLLQFLAAHNTTLPAAGSFDFDRRSIEPDTHIRSDFSHGVTDLLVRLPFRAGLQPSTWIKVYLLFEHLSGHQRHIVPRTVGYAMEVYRLQERRWLQSHKTLQGLLYEAVIPIAIYTGERVWQAPTPFRELVKGGEFFAPFIPGTEPLFLSLPGKSEEELVRDGRALGTVLYVLQQRHAVIDDFHRALTNAVGIVQEHAAEDRHRLSELLSYLTAVVYHFRNVNERDSLRDELERSIRVQTVRKEVHSMGQTIAEALREEGMMEGERKGELKAKRETLIMQLRQKFGGKVTPAIVGNIEKTSDLDMLDHWLAELLDAETLQELGIQARRQQRRR
jgi:hypothetical protein